MILISHRGNLNGRNELLENNPTHIHELSDTYQVEIDLWAVRNSLFLGHDLPQYKIEQTFFNKNMWIHAKNVEAIEFLSNTNYNWFWHTEDLITITSNGTLWCSPNVYIKNGITVMLNYSKDLPEIMGICTDFLKKYI